MGGKIEKLLFHECGFKKYVRAILELFRNIKLHDLSEAASYK